MKCEFKGLKYQRGIIGTTGTLSKQKTVVAGDPYYDNVVLLLPLEDNIGTNQLTDQSLSNKSVVAFNDNAAISSAQSKFGSKSLFLDGTTDWVEYSNSADWIPNVAYTIEFHGYPTTLGAINSAMGYRTSGSQHGWLFGLVSGAPSFFGWGSGDSTPKISLAGPTLSTDAWYHFALSRTTSGFWRLFIDGNLVDSNTETGVITDPSQPLFIGRDITTAGREWAGYLDNIRITRGACRYTENFTPPQVPYLNYARRSKLSKETRTSLVAGPYGTGDPYYDSVSLLLNFDGPNGTTGIRDGSNSQHDVTFNGTAVLDTSQKVFGQSSVSIPLSEDYVYVNSHSDFAFGTDDFTIEFRMRSSNYIPNANAHVIYDHRTSITQTRPTIYAITPNTLNYYVSGANRITYTTALPTNVWLHLAVSRVSGTTRMFLNGTQIGSDYADATNYDAGPVVIGTAGDALGNVFGFANGWIDDLRVTNGVGRYEKNFTPPNVPHRNYKPRVKLIQ